MLRRTQRAVDPALFDNPEVRYSILQNVIRDRMIEKKGADLHFTVSNEQVFERIATDPRFQDNGKFSLDKFKLLLAQAGIPEAAYENSIRQQLLQEKLVEPIAAGGIVAKAAGEGFVTHGRAAARGRRRERRRGAVREGRQGRRRRGPRVLRRERERVPDARGGQVRIRGADARRARGADLGDAGRGEGPVHGVDQAVLARRGAAGRAHPDRRQARCIRRRQGGGEEEGGGPRRARQGESREVRRAREAVLGGPGLRGAGRRSRQQSARHDGQGLRRCRVRDEAGRDRRSGAVGIRLPRDQARRHHAVADAPARRGEGRDRDRPQAAEGLAEVRRRRRPLPEPGLRAGGLARRRREGARPRGEDVAVGDARRRAAARVRQREVRPGAVRPGIGDGEAQHRGDRGGRPTRSWRGA